MNEGVEEGKRPVATFVGGARARELKLGLRGFELMGRGRGHD
jgi:hypothetical protein